MANWFVAFKVDPGNWYGQLAPLLPQSLKIFHPDDLHMTIAFLGNFNEKVNPLDTKKIVEIIRGFTLEPITLNSQGIIVLPSEKHFTAICLDFENPQENGFLHKNKLLLDSITILRDRLLEAAGVAPEKRNFLPHVTVARPHRRLSFLQKEILLGELRKIPSMTIPITLKTVALYTWADHRIHRPANMGANAQNERQFKTVHPQP